MLETVIREGAVWRSRGAIVAVSVLLVGMAGDERLPIHSSKTPAVGREIVVQGRRLTRGLAPIREEGDEESGSERERLARWFESRHRTGPGVDWRVIEERNLQEVTKRVAVEGSGQQPVWHERGPINQTGASAYTAIEPDGRTLLVATSQGGVFSGVPGAASWRRLTDSLGGFIRGFLVSSRPEVWVAATAGSVSAAGQVYVSRNRGATWSHAAGLPPLYTTYELLQDGGNSRLVYLSARAANGPYLLARSRDGGLTFTVVYQGAGERGGVWTSRNRSGPLYLMSNGQLFLSYDQGGSFSPVGRAAAGSDFVLLRGSEAGAPTLYAAVGTGGAPQGLYVSEDGGASWERRYSFPSTYPLDTLFGGAMSASQHDPNLVLFGNQNGWRSTDGGRNFAPVNDWTDYYPSPQNKLHADINGLQFTLYRGQEVLLLNTDGGTYLSTDGGASVQNLTRLGLPSAQFYSVWSSGSNPDLFLTGSQDQGLQLSVPPGPRARPGGTLATSQLISGDYAGLTAATHDLQRVFGVYPSSASAAGFLLLFSLSSGGGEDIESVDLPRFNANIFFSATAADPDDPDAVYVAGDSIWRMRYLGNGQFSQTQLAQTFSRDNDYVTALTVAPGNSAYMYAATYFGSLWYSHDRGATWTESATTQAALPESVSNSLLVATQDPLTCYSGGSGYGAPPVLVTHDGGVTWNPLSNGLPSTLVWALAFDSPATQTLYAATEAGPFVFSAATQSWRSLLGGGAPLGRYFTVEGVPVAHAVRFGTFGRGIWDYLPPPPRR